MVDQKYLSTIILSTIEYDDGLVLTFNEPMTLKPYPDESGELILCDFPFIGSFTYCEIHEELLEDIKEYIRFCWDEFALKDDNKMTLDAIEVKRTLHSTIKAKYIGENE